MRDYSNACVYKIICKDLSIADMYIGSTINFKNRGYLHKSCCVNKNNKAYNYKVYKFIRDNGGWENWEMIKICDVKCLDNYDLCKTEGKYILSLKPTLNKCIAGRTKAEYDKAYNLKNRDKVKAYHLKNRKKINAYQKAYNKSYQRKDKVKSYQKVYQKAYRAKMKLLKSYQKTPYFKQKNP